MRVAVGVIRTQTHPGPACPSRRSSISDLAVTPCRRSGSASVRRTRLARIERGGRVLEHHLHHARRFEPVALAEILSIEHDMSRSRRDQPHDGERERGLAAARLAHPGPRHSPGLTLRLTPSTAFSFLTPPDSALPTVKCTARSSRASRASAMVVAPDECFQGAFPGSGEMPGATSRQTSVAAAHAD